MIPLADGDVSFSPAGLTVIGVLLSTVVGALVFIFKLLLAAKESQLAEIREQRDSYRKGWERAESAKEEIIDKTITDRGGNPIPKIAPVIAQHNSPESERQTEAAKLATLLAREAATEIASHGDPNRFDFPKPPEGKDVDIVIPEQTIHGVKTEPGEKP